MELRHWVYRTTMLVCAATTMACGWSSPEKFYDKQARLSCRFQRKCLRANWNAAGYDNIGDCIDDTVDNRVREAWIEACDEFDKSSARTCLRGMRRQIRKCDANADTNEQEYACAEVCGSSMVFEAGHIGTMRDLVGLPDGGPQDNWSRAGRTPELSDSYVQEGSSEDAIEDDEFIDDMDDSLDDEL